MLQRFEEDRMNMHKNARLTPLGRERIVRQVESGQTPGVERVGAPDVADTFKTTYVGSKGLSNDQADRCLEGDR